MMELTIDRRTGTRTIRNIEIKSKVDNSGFTKYIASLMKEVAMLDHLRKPVIARMGEITSDEWEVATRDVAANNIMGAGSYHDETLIEKLIASIDFLRRHNLGVQDANVS